MSARYKQQATLSSHYHIKNKLIVGYDLWLMGISLLIICIGLVMVASASIAISTREFDDPLHYFWRQGFAAMIGLSLALIILKIPMHLWESCSMSLLILAFIMLALILVPGVGKEVNGSMRWIQFGPFSLQASEPVKLCIIAYLASYLVRHVKTVQTDFRGFIIPIGVLTLISGLLLLEPDFGATVVLFATALGMLFMAGVPLSRFFAWGSVAFCALITLAILSPYRMQRLMSFVDPWKDPYDSGFQLTQALIAFGRGDWFGVGLGSSVQKLFYLPEAHTDFVFSVLAEELGLFGSLIMIFLYSFIIWRAFVIGHIAERVEKYFSAYFAYGIGLIIGIQAYINIGVNMGVLPTKGLTLPLMSYGGNSLIVYCMLLSILLRIEYENRQDVRTSISKVVPAYA
ncbi:MAG TPA: putative lipid II flippase FtsW [Thiotrichaceae bacterium]|jgi:cell division protein FtsW|nr:putative lipid II flippase FtsW [Thiotrichaceae bacterium]HIM07162.1 putative lipid II flippase FtsW [Gammaproteobacteria bacterium]